MSAAPLERLIVLLVAAVQFVNILDFMMVMPLGPDFARALGIPLAHLGIIGGAYTAAASLAGLAGSLFLDRFDRRSALLVGMLGLGVATALGGFATGLGTLVAARVLAGLFGGPATSVALSIIADVIPPERRGRAMGTVMGAFSIASVVGVPLGLEAATRWGWQAPFFAVAGCGLVIVAGTAMLLPSLRGHLDRTEAKPPLSQLFSHPLVLMAYLTTAILMMGSFIVIPNIAAYVQGNLGYPRTGMGFLYLVGGLVSLVATPVAGRLVDRFGSLRVGSFGAFCLLIILHAGFYDYRPWLPVPGIFMAFMLAMSFRNVAYNTLVSKVPSPAERAGFMSVQSAVQHGAAALGAFASSRLLSEGGGHALVGMDRVALVAMSLTLLLPVLFWPIERAIDRRLVVREVMPAASAANLGAEA
jgi:predicted MFS family arabinose efflux permease